ncbi:MAG: GtrA family protein [Pseudanabaenaceae cyanobacterium]
MTNLTSDIHILGAGPAGLSAAYQLSKAGYPVKVIERDAIVGGLAKSFRWHEFIVDFGPHRFFTKIPKVLQLWHEVLEADQVTVKRLTRIYYNNKYFSYPIKIGQVLLTIGIIPSILIFFSYLKAQLFPIRNPKNFSEWVRSQFGDRLFAIFFEGYTEKLWGIPCTEISAEWAAQRIKGLSLWKAIRSAVFGNKGKVKSLVDAFQFPRLGSGQLYEKIALSLQESNQQVLTNCEVKTIHHDGKQVTHITYLNRLTGEEITSPCSHAISSIPINLLLEQMSPSPPEEVLSAARSLKFRNTILVYLLLEGTNLFPDNWLYINDPNVKVGRVTNFANWSPDMLGNDYQTPLCCEYWANFDDPLWQADSGELIALAERELRQIRLIKNYQVVAGTVVKLPRTYPVYTGNYKEAIATIRDYLAQFSNLQLIGRYGAFKYNNQDHSLLMGILASENVIYSAKHDLWSVNSDQEYGEEIVQKNTTGSGRFSTEISVLARQFAGYLLTGGIATVVDVLVFFLLLQQNLSSTIALGISYFCGITTNFLLSRKYVFGVYWGNSLLQYLVFASVALNSLFANLGIMQLLINEFEWPPVSARVFSAACVALLSFIGHKLYSFSQPVKQESSKV